MNKAVRTEVRPTAHNVSVRVPANTAGSASIVIDGTVLAFDPSTSESRAAAIDALERLQRAAAELERHLRVIRIAPEHGGRA